MGIAVVESGKVRASLVEKLELISNEMGESPQVEQHEGDKYPKSRMDRFRDRLEELFDYSALVPGMFTQGDEHEDPESYVEAGLNLAARAIELGVTSVVKAVDFAEEDANEGGEVYFLVGSEDEALRRVEEAFARSV